MRKRDHDAELVSVVQSTADSLERHLDSCTENEELSTMLEAQARTLDKLFHYVGQRAITSPDVVANTRLLRIALRAQAQCVLTARAIGELRGDTVRRQVDFENIGDAELAKIAGMEGRLDEQLEWLDAGAPS